MTELRDWLNSQHPGLRTYKAFRDKALKLCATDTEHRALYRLLANLAGHYITAFDEESLPTDVAKHAYDVFLDLVEGEVFEEFLTLPAYDFLMAEGA